MWNENPFWGNPDEEEPRTERIRQGIAKYVSNPENLLFYVVKSWNDNTVVYEYDPDSDKVVVPCWISLEKEDLERHQKIGNTSLRSNLNPAEHLLMGCSVKIVEGNRFLVKINQEQLSMRTFELVMDNNGNPAVIGAVDGVMCRVEHAYVQMKKGLAPQAEYMNFYGKSLKDGRIVKEKIESK